MAMVMVTMTDDYDVSDDGGGDGGGDDECSGCGAAGDDDGVFVCGGADDHADVGVAHDGCSNVPLGDTRGQVDTGGARSHGAGAGNSREFFLRLRVWA